MWTPSALLDRPLRQWWTAGRAYLDRRALTIPVHVVTPITGPLHPDVAAMLERWRGYLGSRWQPLIHRMRRFDVEAYMPGAVLAKVDRMSMQFALEVRCPLLDVRLGRWAAGLPAKFCHDGKQTKRILKKLAARYLPDDIINRPKMGFGLPDRTWAKDALLHLANDMLLSPHSQIGGRVLGPRREANALRFRHSAWQRHPRRGQQRFPAEGLAD